MQQSVMALAAIFVVAACDVSTDQQQEDSTVQATYIADEGFVFETEEAANQLDRVLADYSQDEVFVVVGDQEVTLVGGHSDQVDGGAYYSLVSNNQTLGEIYVSKSYGSGESDYDGYYPRCRRINSCTPCHRLWGRPKHEVTYRSRLCSRGWRYQCKKC